MLTFDRYFLLLAMTMFSVAWVATSSSTTPDRSGPVPRRDPGLFAAPGQGAGSSRTPDYSSQPKTPDERRKLETELLNGIRTEILRRLGLPYNRTSLKGAELGSGNEGMVNQTMELMRGIEARERHHASRDQPQRKEDKTTMHGASNRAILKTILFGEKVANMTDDSVVQFKLNQNSNRDFLVTAATVTMLVRPRRTGSSNQKPEAERLNIKIYALAGNSTRSHGDPLTEMTILAKRTRIQRLLLPTSFVQEALDSQEKVLRLRIVCDRCGSDAEDDEVPTKSGREQSARSRKKGQPYPRSIPGGEAARKNRLRERPNLPSTPYLTINSKRRSTTPRVQNRMRMAKSSGK